ncbi:TetR/AcrR family transcriptional regulator [Sunxiuqinia sp. sy24]|uniref:TetR/AcrR family transcriptional regulator n=1 Tax=Sunxiuqinia sp. sy24 TaxID=3461495 RepID=UPI0040465FE3
MEVRDRIIEEATRLFFKYGIRSVTMDDIAAGIGISKRTVYENFKDKTELVYTCMRDLMQKQDKINQEVMTNSANVIEALLTSMKYGIKAINMISPLFFHDLKKYYPAIWKPLHEENQKKNYNQIYTQLRKGINEGLFRKEIHVDIVSKLFYEQINLISDEAVFPHDEYVFADLFKSLMINFIRGISTRKGIDLVDEMLR